jgi:putative transposase
MHQQFKKHGFSIYAYCFMPDHCHLLAAALNPSCQICKPVRSFKGVGVTAARRMGIHKLWQANFHERILRSSDDLVAVAAYILQNPVRAGLVKEPDDWTFSGCMLFDWKKRAAG